MTNNTFNVYLRSKESKINKLLEQNFINIESLKSIVWGGMPQNVREKVYPLLLDVFPLEKSENFLIEDLNKKYEKLKKESQNLNIKDKKQIELDVKRMTSALNLEDKEKLLIDILVVYTYVSPEVGYVQAMSDLVLPFVLIFENLLFKESVSFFCAQNFIDNQKINLVGQQEGTNALVERLNYLLKKEDPKLHNHFEKNKSLDLNMFSFRWFNCCFAREFEREVYMLILDTLLTTRDYRMFCVHLAVCILVKFRKQIFEFSEFEAVLFLQELKYIKWEIGEILELLSLVYINIDKYENI